MEQYQPNDAASVLGDWAFLGSPPEEIFADSNTAAQVTATVAQYQSGDANGASGYLGICYEPAGTTSVTVVSQVGVGLNPNVYSPGVTVSGVIGNLAPGEYYVGVCAKDQGPTGGGDTGIVNGGASVTIIMAETASGVNHGTRQGATPTQPPRGG